MKRALEHSVTSDKKEARNKKIEVKKARKAHAKAEKLDAALGLRDGVDPMIAEAEAEAAAAARLLEVAASVPVPGAVARTVPTPSVPVEELTSKAAVDSESAKAAPVGSPSPIPALVAAEAERASPAAVDTSVKTLAMGVRVKDVRIGSGDRPRKNSKVNTPYYHRSALRSLSTRTPYHLMSTARAPLGNHMASHKHLTLNAQISPVYV